MASSELIAGIGFVVFGIYSFWKDQRVRSGRDRSWLKLYHNPAIPFWMRNAPLVARFAGTMGLGWGLGSLASWATATGALPELPGALIALSLIGLGTVGMVLALVGSLRAPESLKPDWLREEERGAAPAQTETPRSGAH